GRETEPRTAHPNHAGWRVRDQERRHAQKRDPAMVRLRHYSHRIAWGSRGQSTAAILESKAVEKLTRSKSTPKPRRALRLRRQGESFVRNVHRRAVLGHIHLRGPEDAVDDHSPKRLDLEILVRVAQRRGEGPAAVGPLVHPAHDHLLVLAVAHLQER